MPGDLDHPDELQAVPVRALPGSGDEAGAGGRHAQAKARGETETGEPGRHWTQVR